VSKGPDRWGAAKPRGVADEGKGYSIPIPFLGSSLVPSDSTLNPPLSRPPSGSFQPHPELTLIRGRGWGDQALIKDSLIFMSEANEN